MYQLSPESAAEQIAWIRQRGLLGYCLFSYDSCMENPKHGEMLMKQHPAGTNALPPEFKPYLRREK